MGISHINILISLTLVKELIVPFVALFRTGQMQKSTMPDVENCSLQVKSRIGILKKAICNSEITLQLTLFLVAASGCSLDVFFSKQCYLD